MFNGEGEDFGLCTLSYITTSAVFFSQLSLRGAQR